ncbi:MAG: hypothetical protein HKP56_01975 [Anderseniella sp.]|nr:hypothetical protein [Anderseniella sp.]
MSEYIRKRLAIGAMPSSQDVCNSVRKLSTEFPDVPPVYILFNGPQERKVFEAMSEKHLQPQVRSWVCALENGDGRRKDETTPVATHGWLNAQDILEFQSWMDQRLASPLAETLTQNRSLIFLQFSRSSQEAFAYGVL